VGLIGCSRPPSIRFEEQFVTKLFEENNVGYVEANTHESAIKEREKEGSGLQYAMRWCREMQAIKEKTDIRIAGKRFFTEDDVPTLREKIKKGWWADPPFGRAIAGGTGVIVTCQVADKTIDTVLVFKDLGKGKRLVFLADD
jgi:hypothetical protein